MLLLSKCTFRTETTMDNVPQRTILVIDDDHDIREFLGGLLTQEGYAVTATSNGEQALWYLREAAPPALILLDLHMPVMNGPRFLVELRLDPRLCDVPVIIVSGEGDVKRRAEASGVTFYLEKPIEVRVLLAAVRRFGGPGRKSRPPVI